MFTEIAMKSGTPSSPKLPEMPQIDPQAPSTIKKQSWAYPQPKKKKKAQENHIRKVLFPMPKVPDFIMEIRQRILFMPTYPKFWGAFLILSGQRHYLAFMVHQTGLLTTTVPTVAGDKLRLVSSTAARGLPGLDLARGTTQWLVPNHFPRKTPGELPEDCQPDWQQSVMLDL